MPVTSAGVGAVLPSCGTLSPTAKCRSNSRGHSAPDCKTDTGLCEDVEHGTPSMCARETQMCQRKPCSLGGLLHWSSIAIRRFPLFLTSPAASWHSRFRGAMRLLASQTVMAAASTSGWQPTSRSSAAPSSRCCAGRQAAGKLRHAVIHTLRAWHMQAESRVEWAGDGAGGGVAGCAASLPLFVLAVITPLWLRLFPTGAGISQPLPPLQQQAGGAPPAAATAPRFQHRRRGPAPARVTNERREINDPAVLKGTDLDPDDAGWVTVDPENPLPNPQVGAAPAWLSGGRPSRAPACGCTFLEACVICSTIGPITVWPEWRHNVVGSRPHPRRATQPGGLAGPLPTTDSKP